ncbi:TNT domain-containing protein [Sinomonas sp. G460-2]|uniref:TNT domain-containing protein n=1 Tax=Sinomonas sp. G460-2 TaxID=3393464 RepID=UPI0039F08865
MTGQCQERGVQYRDLDALLRDYPELRHVDRLGGESGPYLAGRGTPFEQRSLTPGHTAFEYNRYELTGTLPPHVHAEVSRIESGLGFPGGGWQIRFWDEKLEEWVKVKDLLNPEEYGVLKG